MTLIYSSKNNPCPVCDRTHDGDCRQTEDGGLVLCHTEINGRAKGQELNGYTYLKPTTDHRCGQWLKKTENWVKPLRDEQSRHWDYCDRQGNSLIRVHRRDTSEGKKIWQTSLIEGKTPAELLPLVMPYRYAECVDAQARGETIFWVEGEPCADALWLLGIPATTTIRGCGGYRSERDRGLFDPDLLVIAPDRDQAGVKYAQAIAADYPGAKWLYADPQHREWVKLPASGGFDAADWIDMLKRQGLSSEEVKTKILGAIEPQREQENPVNEETATENSEDKTWSQSGLAGAFVRRYADQYHFCNETEQWYAYKSEYWQPVSRRSVELEFIQLIAGTTQQAFKTDLIRGAAYIAGVMLGDRPWENAPNLLPLKNGVLDLATKKLLPHSPGYGFRWQLPYQFDPGATCPKIQQWLLETVQGDQELVQILRAFLNAVLKGRTDLQKFLELVGPGGTGKSTYIRLAQALVGGINSFATELKRLEGNRFEAAGLVDKRLCVITDSEHYAGPVSILKSITGQDSIPLERKYQDPTAGFTPQAMVIVASNETVQSGDYTSGLSRRRLTIPFLNRVSPENQRDLISFAGGEVKGDFAPELSGLLNWVLAMSDQEVTHWIKRGTAESVTLQRYKIETLLQSNPIAAWAAERLIADPGAITQVGSARKIRQTDSTTGESWDTYEGEATKLYPNFADFCLVTGQKLIGLKRFIPLLKDLVLHQFNLPIEQVSESNRSAFKGLAIRAKGDIDSPSLFQVPQCDSSTKMKQCQEDQTSDRKKEVFEKYPVCPVNGDLSRKSDPVPPKSTGQIRGKRDKRGKFEKVDFCDRTSPISVTHTDSEKLAHDYRAGDRLEILIADTWQNGFEFLNFEGESLARVINAEGDRLVPLNQVRFCTSWEGIE